MLSVFGSPSRYVQGPDATWSLGPEMVRLGLIGNVLVIAGRSAIAELSDVWKATFSAESIKYSVHHFGGECSRAEIEIGKEEAKKINATVILGAGGGKVLDAARAVADDLGLPIINCPTVASSDAPCSALSVVYTAEGEFQEYLFYKRNPDLVLVDTSVIAKSPPRLLVAGMGDALATWFEAKTVIDAGKANQLGGRTTIAAGALAEICYETLLEDGVAALNAVRARHTAPSLERLVEANTLLSGLGFESGGLAVAHSVHNGLTVLPPTHDFYHGEKVAFGLIVQLVMEEKPEGELDEVMNFCIQVGLPVSLAEVGLPDISDDWINKIAQRTVQPGEDRHNEPFEVTAQLVAKSIRLADKLGTLAREQVNRA